MTQFRHMCEMFAGLDVFQEPEPSLKTKEDRANTYAWRNIDYVSMRERMKAVRDHMPRAYRTRFVDKITSTTGELTPQIEAALRDIYGTSHGSDALRPAIADWAERLEFAATGWRPDWEAGHVNGRVLIPLLHKVVEEFYHRTISEVSPHLNSTVVDQLNDSLAPLVTVAPTRLWGPSTLNAADVEKSCGADVAIVSMPWTYAHHPVLWTVLSHEVGGHDVMHALGSHTCGAGVVTELTKDIATSLGVATSGVPQEWLLTWQTWAEEAIADVFGMLTMGPGFTVNLCAWLSAAKAHDPYGPYVELGTLSGTIYTRFGTIVGQHPPDLLRLHLALGVLDALKEVNGLGGMDFWPDVLEAIAADVRRGTDVLTVYETSSNTTTIQYDASDACSIARRVGKHIASVKLQKLDSNSLSGILQWTARDENIARQISKEVTRGAAGATAARQFLEKDGDLRSFTCPRLFAGANHALYQGTASYDAATAFLFQGISSLIPTDW